LFALYNDPIIKKKEGIFMEFANKQEKLCRKEAVFS